MSTELQPLGAFVGPQQGWRAGQVPSGMWTERVLRNGRFVELLEGERHWCARHGAYVISKRFAAFDEAHARRLVQFWCGLSIAQAARITEIS